MTSGSGSLDRFTAVENQTLQIDPVPCQKFVEVRVRHTIGRFLYRALVGTESAKELGHGFFGSLAIHRHEDLLTAT